MSAVKKQYSLRKNPFKWTRWIIETKDICYDWRNENELKDFDDFWKEYGECQEVKEKIYRKSEETEYSEKPDVVDIEKDPVKTVLVVSKESVEVLPQASKPVFDTIVPIQEKDALAVSEEQEIISKVISELSFSVMSAEESAKNNIEKLQYKFSALPKDPYRIIK